jgi:hypothetical protein
MVSDIFMTKETAREIGHDHPGYMCTDSGEDNVDCNLRRLKGLRAMGRADNIHQH